MSITIKTILRCDTCRMATAVQVDDSEALIGQLKEKAAEAGWNVDGDTHQCAKCAPAAPKVEEEPEEKPEKKTTKKKRSSKKKK